MMMMMYVIIISMPVVISVDFLWVNNTEYMYPISHYFSDISRRTGPILIVDRRGGGGVILFNDVIRGEPQNSGLCNLYLSSRNYSCRNIVL